MTIANLVFKIEGKLAQALLAHRVEASQPREQMLQLNAIPLGPSFNKRCTNALLRSKPDEETWSAYVDEDLSYDGDDAARKESFSGPRRKGWLELVTRTPVVGDINRGILWLLSLLDSPARHEPSPHAVEARRAPFPDEGQAEGRPETLPLAGHPRANPPAAGPARIQPGLIDNPLLRKVGRWLDLAAMLPASFVPTDLQSEAALRVAECVSRDWAPRCPLLLGPAGSGRSSVARLAARTLLRQGLVEQVLQLNGAALASGAIFWPERDERLRQTMTLLEEHDPLRRVLVIIEQSDLALMRSEVAGGVLSCALDAGARVIAVARPGYPPKPFRGAAELRRRLEPVAVRPMAPDDALRVVQQCWSAHPLSRELELSAELPGLIVSLARRRPGAAPGSTLGLLDAVARRAVLVGQKCVGPDDLYHLVSKS